jgi:hypothetical protein
MCLSGDEVDKWSARTPGEMAKIICGDVPPGPTLPREITTAKTGDCDTNAVSERVYDAIHALAYGNA